MAIVMGKLYSALRATDVAEDKATEAAEEVASFENRTADLGGELRPVQWMLGFNLALTELGGGIANRNLSRCRDRVLDLWIEAYGGRPHPSRTISNPFGAASARRAATNGLLDRIRWASPEPVPFWLAHRVQ